MIIFPGVFFYIYSISAIMIYFSKSLPFSTSNAQVTKEPPKQPNCTAKIVQSTLKLNKTAVLFFILLFDEFYF